MGSRREQDLARVPDRGRARLVLDGQAHVLASDAIGDLGASARRARASAHESSRSAFRAQQRASHSELSPSSSLMRGACRLHETKSTCPVVLSLREQVRRNLTGMQTVCNGQDPLGQ